LIEESKFFAHHATPEQTYDQIEQGQQIKKLLAGLAVDQRTAVILVDIHGYQYEEAAQIMGVPLGTVKSRLSRARPTDENAECGVVQDRSVSRWM
jgi:RNA polymerase sigma-70 factor (ECF subfamily)